MDTNNTENRDNMEEVKEQENVQQNQQASEEKASDQTETQPAMPKEEISTNTSAPAGVEGQQQANADATYVANKGGKRTIMLIGLLILLIVVLAVAGYMILVRGATENKDATPVENTAVVTPTITPTPTIVVPESVEEIEIESPDADINELEENAQEL